MLKVMYEYAKGQTMSKCTDGLPEAVYAIGVVGIILCKANATTEWRGAASRDS
jgi:hypothetical protein